MRLADFILANREPVLAEWEVFARTCAPASGSMDVAALRDHADGMLTVIATDLATPQGRLAQTENSQGRAPVEDDDATTAAEEHGSGRARSGFTVAQMVAEYRALRAGVIRLWTASEGALDTSDIEDLTRFSRAIDQALAESILRFNEDVEQAEETFLAILGHDLRTPLGAIQTSASFMLETAALTEAERTLVAGIAGRAARRDPQPDENAALTPAGGSAASDRESRAGALHRRSDRVRARRADRRGVLRGGRHDIHGPPPPSEAATGGVVPIGPMRGGRARGPFSHSLPGAPFGVGSRSGVG